MAYVVQADIPGRDEAASITLDSREDALEAARRWSRTVTRALKLSAMVGSTFRKTSINSLGVDRPPSDLEGGSFLV